MKNLRISYHVFVILSKIFIDRYLLFLISGEDEEWSDSEKTPSVSSGVDGGGSAVSSPIAPPVVEEDSSLPPPPRLNPASSSTSSSTSEDIRLRLSVLEDTRKRLVSLTEDIEVINFIMFVLIY